MADEVARALNRVGNRALLDTLSANDRAAMTDLVEEFFCNAVGEEDEQGMHYSMAEKQVYYKLCAMTRFGEW